MAGAGWPNDWSERVAGRDCPICASLATGDDNGGVVVAELASSVVRLERRTTLPGYCTVVWKAGHVAEPTDLAPEAASRFWGDVLAAGRAVQAHFQPVKMNYLLLGNWVPHLHAHVVPRYPDDPAAGGPIAYEAIVAGDPVADEVLQAQAASLRGLLRS